MSDIKKLAQDYVVRERSDYQLRNFVVGQHDTPEMRYRQILIEIKQLVTNIRLAELDVEKKRIKLDRLTSDPLDKIKAEKLRLGIAITLDHIQGAHRELSCLVSLADEYPHYTPQDIEDNQREYWEARLSRQANIERMSVTEQVSAANLTSMLYSGLFHKEIEQ